MTTFGALSHQQKQEQKITSSLIQGLNMLSLPTQAMYDYLVELSVGNPMLEIPEPPSFGKYDNVSGNSNDSLVFDCTGRDSSFAAGSAGEASYDSEEDFDPYYAKGVEFEAEALNGSLKLQLSMCCFSDIEQAIGLEIIDDLDESGYFVGNLDTVCLLYCQPRSVGEKVLDAIQHFQPLGIAAANVHEALCLQVDEALPWADTAKQVITNDLQALCDGCTAHCAKKYQVSRDIMAQIFDYIRTLEPRPGNCDIKPAAINYIQPDIIVKNDDGELLVYISGELDNALRLDSYYLDMLKQPELSAEDKQYLRTNLNTARSLIRSVDIRRQTMQKAALSLVSLQGDFFRFGPDGLQPMTMQQLADKMGVNVSTVSRLAQDKYVSTPWGLFPLKHFFTRALKSIEGSTVSSATAKMRIERLIEEEDATAPITDEQIKDILNREGCAVSRRTVTKYRQAAGIAGYINRRRRDA